MKKRFKFVALIASFILFICCNYCFADVGSFESYDSGGSSYSSSDSWSSYDSDYSYSGGGYSGGYSGGGSIFAVVFIGIMIFAIIYSLKQGKNNNPRPNTVPITNSFETEEQIEAKVKANDPMFNKEEFLSWSRSLFVKLQEAWTARDWSTIRTFESNELFEQHKRQLQGYIDNNQINVMERICVKSARLSSFTQVGDKDILKVTLSSKMIDYIIDADTKKILKGDKVTERHSTYSLSFVRKTGVKTKAGTSEVNTTNCPNCGAPTQITSSGKCEYCGSVITTGEYSWVLADLTKIG